MGITKGQRRGRAAGFWAGISLMLLPVIAGAQDGQLNAKPFPAAATQVQAEGTLVGVDEHLGAKLPLDLVFRDETGRSVRLGELITGPTIILPVYYSCSNVCNYMQGGLARILPSIKRAPGTEYRVLSISIDETETPELAARYQNTAVAEIKSLNDARKRIFAPRSSKREA